MVVSTAHSMVRSTLLFAALLLCGVLLPVAAASTLPNSNAHDSDTELHDAARKLDVNRLYTLQAQGGNPYARNQHNQTPIDIILQRISEHPPYAFRSSHGEDEPALLSESERIEQAAWEWANEQQRLVYHLTDNTDTSTQAGLTPAGIAHAQAVDQLRRGQADAFRQTLLGDSFYWYASSSFSQLALEHYCLACLDVLIEEGYKLEATNSASFPSLLLLAVELTPTNEAERTIRLALLQRLLNHPERLAGHPNALDFTPRANGVTALFRSVQKGDVAVATLLLQQGANATLLARPPRLSSRWQSPHTPLIAAVLSGQTEMVNTLLAHAAPIINMKPAGWTALHVAAHGDSNNAQGQQMQITQRLLEAGAEIDAYNHQGYSPLAIAILHNRPDVVTLLRQQGASLALKENNSSQLTTVIALAALYASIETLHFLTDDSDTASGAFDIDARTEALTRVVKIGGNSTLQTDWSERITLLLKRGADLNKPDAQGNTALHWAARYGYTAAAGQLLQHGADPDVRNRDGHTPAMLAYHHKQPALPLSARN